MLGNNNCSVLSKGLRNPSAAWPRNASENRITGSQVAQEAQGQHSHPTPQSCGYFTTANFLFAWAAPGNWGASTSLSSLCITLLFLCFLLLDPPIRAESKGVIVLNLSVLLFPYL